MSEKIKNYQNKEEIDPNQLYRRRKNITKE